MVDFDKLKKIADAANPRMPGDYEKDGLLYCGKCNTPKQSVVKLPWTTFTAGCMCKCESERYNREQAAMQEDERLRRINNLRINGINDRSIDGMTFDSDDGSNPKKIDLARRYVAKWSELYKENVGLLFYGNTGNGKTFTAACIANALIEKGVPVLMTSFGKIIAQVTGMYAEDRVAYMESINQFDLLIIDDLGTERQSEYALEQVYNVIDSRYKAGKPLIVTTNLEMSQLKNPQDMTYQRIYDRVLEMCMQIHFDGESRRKALSKQKLDKAKNILMGSE